MKKTPAALMRLYEDALNDYIKSGKTAIPASAQSIACNSCNTLANATVLIDRHEAIVREATQLPCTAEKRILTVDRAAQFLASAISPPVLPCGDACSNCDVRRFAIAALRATGPITILDCANVNTSFPGFVALMAGAGLRIQEQAPR